MKNLKKVLAMVLAFACTFTMFASAKVYEDVQPGTEFSEAITMLSDLGIIQGKTDNKYHPEDTITRAEACALIARLMTGDPNAAGFNNAHHFKDVPAGFWASSAIGYCVVNGIAIGVDDAGTRFEPQRPIKDKEFVTMIVRALGYETPDMRNNFPFGYMSAARAIGLLQDVNMVPDTDALRGEDAQVIYNALFADYARGAKRLNVAHGTNVESYPTLAESVWHLDRAAVGTWDKKNSDDETATLSNCKAHTWVVIGHDPEEKNHLLAYPIKDESSDLYDSKEKNAFRTYSFKYEGEGDIDSIKGYQVELWGAGTHGEPTWDKGDNKFVYSKDWKIKAIKTVKGQTKVDYNPSMADKKDDNGEIEMEEKTLKLESVADNVKHISVTAGGALDQFVAKDYNNESKMDTDKKVEAALNIRDGAQYRLMDWDSDGDIDWIVVDTANYYKVESVTAKSVTVSWMKPEMKWENSKTSEKQTWKRGDSTKFEGDFDVKYEIPEDVKEGDILEVTYKTTATSEKTYEGKVAVVDAENHKLEKVSTKGGLTLTFDDKEIKVAQDNDKGDVIVPKNPTTYRDFNNEELGTEFALSLNRNGFILHSDYVTETASYAMVLDTRSGSDRVSNRELGKVDLLTSKNEHLKDVEVTENATMEGYSKREFKEELVVGNVYKYWTNDKGQITKMRQVITEPEKMPGEVRVDDYNYDADSDTLKDGNRRYVASLKDADVIFAVKPNNKAEFGAATTNAGYIQAEKALGGRTDFFVDVDDVLAVEQSDIPDIVRRDSTETDKTRAALLDNKVDGKERTQTWLGGYNNGDNTNYINTFVAKIDKNGEAEAAILGVDSFNKFNAGSTKIGLVTDVTYSNSADGKYVEMTAAFGGENKTIESAKKVDFDDVVKVYNSRTKKDVDVASPSVKVEEDDNRLFGGSAFDKYLEDNAAYAEITTDKDGKLTKLTFLDTADAHNKLVGHYYSVSRNITLDANEKTVGYMLNDGTSQSANDNIYVAKQYFADDDKLYSVPQDLARNRSTFAGDATFYSIKGRATRHDRKYDGKELNVVDGFERTPDITAGGTYSVIEHSTINNDSNDYYAVADIVLNNSDDVAAVYAFDDTFEEASAKDVSVIGMDSTSNEVKAGETIKLTAVAVDSNTETKVVKYKVVASNNTDVTAEWTVVGGDDLITAKKSKVWDVKVPTTANGKYTIYAVNVDGKESKIGALEVNVTEGKQQKWNVTELAFVAPNKNKEFNKVTKVAAKDQHTIYVYVGGDDITPATRMMNPGVTGLTKDSFIVTVNSDADAATVVTNCTAVANNPGVYALTLNKTLKVDDSITFKLKSNANLTMTAQVANGVSGYVGTITADDGNQGGETTPDAVATTLKVKTVVDDKNIVVEILDQQGNSVKDAKISATDVTVTNNGDGTYSLAGSATLNNKTIIVNGKAMKLPATLTPNKQPSMSGLLVNPYKINSKTKGEVTLTKGTLTEVNIAGDYKLTEVAGLPSLKFDTATKQVVANAEELNKMTAGTVKTTLSAGGVELPLVLEIVAEDASVDGVTITEGNKEQVKASATYDVVVADGATLGKVLVAVNGENAAQATEIDLSSKKTSEDVAKAIKDGLNENGYTFTAVKKDVKAKAAGEVWTIKVEADNYKKDENVSLAIVSGTGVTLENPQVVTAKDKTAGVAKVAIPASMEAGEWTLTVNGTAIKVIVDGNESASDIALKFAREGEKSAAKDNVVFTVEKNVVVITEKETKFGETIKDNGVTLAKSGAAVELDKDTVKATAGAAVSETVTVNSLVNANEADLSIWASNASYKNGQTEVANDATGLTANLKGKKVTITGTAKEGTFKFNIGVSNSVMKEVTVTVEKAKASITLNEASKNVTALECTGEVDVSVQNGTSEQTIVVSDQTITESTATTEATIDGVKVKFEQDKLKISGTPTKNGNARTFHIGIKGTTTEKTFTVNIDKVTLTGEAALNSGKDKIEITLKKDSNSLQDADLNKLDLAKTATGYELTAGGKTVQSAAVENNKLVLTLNEALTGGSDVTALTVKATNFMNAVTIDTVS